jgi:hypothetical protein
VPLHEEAPLEGRRVRRSHLDYGTTQRKVQLAKALLKRNLPLPVDLTTRLLGDGVDVAALEAEYNL